MFIERTSHKKFKLFLNVGDWCFFPFFLGTVTRTRRGLLYLPARLTLTDIKLPFSHAILSKVITSMKADACTWLTKLMFNMLRSKFNVACVYVFSLVAIYRFVLWFIFHFSFLPLHWEKCLVRPVKNLFGYGYKPNVLLSQPKSFLSVHDEFLWKFIISHTGWEILYLPWW